MHNEGGLCIAPVSESITQIDQVEAAPRLHYRIGAHARRELGVAVTTPPKVRARWDLGAFGEVLGDWIVTDEIATLSDLFIRFETQPGSIVSPAGTVGVSIEIKLDADAAFIALDNIVLWEETPPCFDDCSL